MAIQIGTLRTWTQKDDTQSKPFFKNLNNFHYKDLRECFDSVEADLPKHLGSAEQFNLFYTVGHHLQGQRTKSSWQCQDIIPFDLDGIDLEQIDLYPPIVAEVCGFDLSKTSIIYSGNGCHILVQVPLIKNEDGNDFVKDAKLGYKQLLTRVKEACDKVNLPFDIDTTALDYARILRVPFTVNKKVKKQEDGSLLEVIKECKLIQNNLEEQDWSIPHVKKVKESLSLKVGSFPTPDHHEVATSCDFFKWLNEKPDEVHEPHAYAMLSIAGHFNDDNITANNLYVKFSSPSISAKPFDEFLEQALSTSGPRTCKGIDDVWGKCSTCPNYQKVTSPILLKGPDHIGTEHMGFTTMSISGKTKVRHYEDLVNYFKRECHYKYIPESSDIFIYDETHYKKFHVAQVKKYAQDEFRKPVKESERVEYLKAVEASDFTPMVWLESKPEGKINLKNGVLDLETNTLAPHSPDYSFTTCLPFDYEPTATCPNWDKFIDDVTLSRPDLINILHEYMGYCAYGGEYRFHKALVLSGGGKNGKSTFIDVLRAILGNEGISTVPLTSLSKDVFAMADMQGKLANISEEEPPSCFKETGVFKNLTGNNVVRAQKKFKDPFKMLSRAKIVITYNELPFIGDTTTGMRRRLLIVPFDFNLEKSPDKVNANIKNDLDKELSGIFNHVLAGWHRLEKQEGFTKSAVVDNAVKDVVESSNSFYVWLDERVDEDDASDERFKISANDIYMDYIDFMESSRESNRKGRSKFYQEMKNHGYIKTTIRINTVPTKGFKGLRLKKLDKAPKF